MYIYTILNFRQKIQHIKQIGGTQQKQTTKQQKFYKVHA